MQIQDCFAGQRVVYKENGRSATIKDVDLQKAEIEIVFDNSARARVHPRLLEPSLAEAGVESAPSGPMRPCPQCAAKMSASATTCPSCGFQYGVETPKQKSGVLKFAVILIALAGIAYAVWKYVLHERLPW